jgi:hypothetical protein
MATNEQTPATSFTAYEYEHHHRARVYEIMAHSAVYVTGYAADQLDHPKETIRRRSNRAIWVRQTETYNKRGPEVNKIITRIYCFSRNARNRPGTPFL